jgi:hypothetical protein
MPTYQTPFSDGGSRDCGTFFLDVAGQYVPENLVVRWSAQARPSNADIDRGIERTWTEETRNAVQAGRKLYDGRLCRLIQCQVEGHRLILTLGKVSFKECLGTNLTHANLRYVHGPEVMSDALGVSAAIATRDGFILLGRRSEKVMYHSGRIHPFGGFMESGDVDGVSAHPYPSVLRQVVRETNLSAPLLQDAVCLGIVRDKHTVQPELIFDITADIDAAAARSCAMQAEGRQDHTELVPVRNHPAAVLTFIEQRFGELTAVGLAALLLHGLRHWGSGWFAAARGYLRSVI